MGLYPVCLLGTALDDYDIGGIPIAWLIRVSAVLGLLDVGLVHPLSRVPGTASLLAMFVWAMGAIAVNMLWTDNADLQPLLATTGHYLFVGLRLVTVLAFLATMYLVCWLFRSGYAEALLRRTVIVGTIVAPGARYVHFAQLNNLPEPPRTRIGTGSVEQATRFSYPFHRAMGSFREPAYLAEWLVLPFRRPSNRCQKLRQRTIEPSKSRRTEGDGEIEAIREMGLRQTRRVVGAPPEESATSASKAWPVSCCFVTHNAGTISPQRNG